MEYALNEIVNADFATAWDESSQPAWLTSNVFSQRIQPLLAAMSASAIARQISISRWYAGRIREGYRPHPRHWQALARLASVSVEGERANDCLTLGGEGGILLPPLLYLVVMPTLPS
jgi:hypothetical protein